MFRSFLAIALSLSLAGPQSLFAAITPSEGGASVGRVQLTVPASTARLDILPNRLSALQAYVTNPAAPPLLIDDARHLLTTVLGPDPNAHADAIAAIKTQIERLESEHGVATHKDFLEHTQNLPSDSERKGELSTLADHFDLVLPGLSMDDMPTEQWLQARHEIVKTKAEAWAKAVLDLHFHGSEQDEKWTTVGKTLDDNLRRLGPSVPSSISKDGWQDDVREKLKKRANASAASPAEGSPTATKSLPERFEQFIKESPVTVGPTDSHLKREDFSELDDSEFKELEELVTRPMGLLSGGSPAPFPIGEFWPLRHPLEPASTKIRLIDLIHYPVFVFSDAAGHGQVLVKGPRKLTLKSRNKGFFTFQDADAERDHGIELKIWRKHKTEFVRARLDAHWEKEPFQLALRESIPPPSSHSAMPTLPDPVEPMPAPAPTAAAQFRPLLHPRELEGYLARIAPDRVESVAALEIAGNSVLLTPLGRRSPATWKEFIEYPRFDFQSPDGKTIHLWDGSTGRMEPVGESDGLLIYDTPPNRKGDHVRLLIPQAGVFSVGDMQYISKTEGTIHIRFKRPEMELPEQEIQNIVKTSGRFVLEGFVKPEGRNMPPQFWDIRSGDAYLTTGDSPELTDIEKLIEGHWSIVSKKSGAVLYTADWRSSNDYEIRLNHRMRSGLVYDFKDQRDGHKGRIILVLGGHSEILGIEIEYERFRATSYKIAFKPKEFSKW